MKILFIILLICVTIYLIYLYNNTKEKFVDFNKKNINQKELLDIIMKTTNNVLDKQDLKPKFKEYTRNLVRDFSIENINKLKNQKNQVKLSSRAKKIADMNSTILKSNKNIKILVINNKRYIFDKKTNKKIREETLEFYEPNFDFEVDRYYSEGDTYNSCTGNEGLNPLCPCTDPNKTCWKDKIGYCCYGVSASNKFGNCRNEPCPDDWNLFFEYYFPKILYTIGGILVGIAIGVILGVAATISAALAPWILILGLGIIVATAIYDYIKGGLGRTTANTGFRIKEIYINLPETDNIENGLTIGEEFNKNDVDNVVVISDDNVNNSGIIGNTAYISTGRIPKSILDNLIEMYFYGIELKPINCTNVKCDGTLKYGISFQKNMEILKCCMKNLIKRPTIDIVRQANDIFPTNCNQWKNFGICTNINDVYNLPFVVNTTGGAQMVDMAYRECCEQPPVPQTQECSSVCVYDPSTGKTIRNVMCDGRLTATFEDPSCCKRECRNGITYEICQNLDGQRVLNTGKRC